MQRKSLTSNNLFNQIKNFRKCQTVDANFQKEVGKLFELLDSWSVYSVSLTHLAFVQISTSINNNTFGLMMNIKLITYEFLPANQYDIVLTA